MKCRYIYYPMTAKRIGRRMTVVDLFHRWQRIRRERKNAPDVFTVTGFNAPTYPGK